MCPPCLRDGPTPGRETHSTNESIRLLLLHPNVSVKTLSLALLPSCVLWVLVWNLSSSY